MCNAQNEHEMKGKRLPSKITFFFIAPALTTSKSETKYSLEWKPSLLEAREVQSCRWITSSWMLFFVRVRRRGLHVTVRSRSASRHECGDVAVPPSVQQQEMEELRGRRAAHHRMKRDLLLINVAGDGRTSCTRGCFVLQHTRAGQRPWTMPLVVLY